METAAMEAAVGEHDEFDCPELSDGDFAAGSAFGDADEDSSEDEDNVERSRGDECLANKRGQNFQAELLLLQAIDRPRISGGDRKSVV
jgi:hypothetical protein